MRQLIEKKEVILSVMNQFFSKQDQQTRARIAYVEGRFNDIDTFIETQVSAYKESLTIFNERLTVKTDLENLYARETLKLCLIILKRRCIILQIRIDVPVFT